MSEASTAPVIQGTKLGKDARALVLEHASNELVFAVVGHVGSGTSTIANALKELLRQSSYDAEILKARDEIQAWAKSTERNAPIERDNLAATQTYQDLGDELREASKDHAAVARKLIAQIRQTRAKKLGVKDLGDAPVKPDGTKRAYILDSIRHPAEVQLLRHIYQDAFILIGIVCEENRRLARVEKKYDVGETQAKDFMKRDAKAQQKHGQRVQDAFHLSDFFLDNTVERLNKDGTASPSWDVNEKLSRLIKIVTHAGVTRPESGETAMYHAHGAAIRSACLSRQVGAALLDGAGNVISTGTNEVPQAGGGVYGEGFDEKQEEPVEGTLRRAVELASGKVALIQRGHDFTLVPWRSVLDNHIGKQVSGMMRGDGGISWTIGKQRGLGIG